MEAFRHTYEVVNNKLIITLPEDFKASKVDVIVLPTQKADTDWYNELTKEQKEDIEIGLKELDEGKGIPKAQVQKEIDKLFGRI